MEFASGGWPISSTQYAPFGAELPSNTFTANHYKFTGKERDAESGLDYFGARYYASSTGRWTSPDWADKPEAVPYSKLDNPQSLNLYGYVNNNPLSRVDADGHEGCCDVLPSKEEVDTALASIAAASTTAGEFTITTLAAPLVAIGGLLAYTPAAGSAHEDQVLQNEAAQRQSEHSEAVPEPETSTGGAGARQGGNGRGGKQARLRDIAGDDKASSADRGWIKSEQNQIKNGNRSSIRVPPGKNLAHRRGKKARKGYDYGHSDLQDKDLHDTQHRLDKQF